MIKKFDITKKKSTGIFGKIIPDKFQAEIEGNEQLKKLICEVKSKIYQINLREDNGAFQTGGARIPYDNLAIDEEKGLGGFVLLNEVPVVGGRNINEAIYGIKKDETNLKGKLITFDTNLGDSKKYFRHIINGIEGNGILKYRIINKKGEKNYCFDLRRL